jgi:ribosomal protein L21E
MPETYSQATQTLLANLDNFTEEELLHLNRLIVERLRLMQQVRAHRTMTQFRVGQRVKFNASNGRVVVGMLTKYNRKSVGVVADTGEIWTVAPGLLQPAD